MSSHQSGIFLSGKSFLFWMLILSGLNTTNLCNFIGASVSTCAVQLWSCWFNLARPLCLQLSAKTEWSQYDPDCQMDLEAREKVSQCQWPARCRGNQLQARHLLACGARRTGVTWSWAFSLPGWPPPQQASACGHSAGHGCVYLHVLTHPSVGSQTLCQF